MFTYRGSCKTQQEIIEKQEIWRQKQLQIFYGSGRPIYGITDDNLYVKPYYNGDYFMTTKRYNNLHNKNFIP